LDLRHCLAPEGILSTIPRTSSPCVATISIEIFQLQILDAFFRGWVEGVTRISSLQPFLTWRWAESRNCLASACKCFLCHRHEASSFGIATRYGLDGPGIESRWGRDFPRPSSRPSGPPSLLLNGYRVFPGGKADGVWR